MTKKKGFFISCDEANHNCDKSQYDEASLWEKIKLNIHLLYCRACREYSSKNAKLSRLMRKPEVECLDMNEKNKLREAFERELSNN